MHAAFQHYHPAVESVLDLGSCHTPSTIASVVPRSPVPVLILCHPHNSKQYPGLNMLTLAINRLRHSMLVYRAVLPIVDVAEILSRALGRACLDLVA